ncbi:MAG: penicillin acylase family protein, partial [Cyclobacteriaceae bacterium]|nr:penicillin acylase family protein [Cyclobacteriaceae bacterium HetDA_MAG_MS6]
MKTFRFVFFFVLTLSAVIFLNQPYDNIPPLGKLLSPHDGFWQNAESEMLDIIEEMSLDGLKDKVTIKFDEQLIPHIFATNDHDLYFTQGYITAYHRLWQMEFQLLATAGRISEVLGERAVDFDRSQRRKGLTYGARRALKELQKDPKLYAVAEAYTQGVNAYIDQLSYADYPIEYKLLDYKPEPWTVFKCVLLLKEMADQLSRGERDLEHTNALKLWGRDIFEVLYPEIHPGLDPVIPSGTPFDFEALKVTKPNVQFPLKFTKTQIDPPDPRNGSNSFVVNGQKTADGSVILANEPDLGLNLPSIWYLAHLNAPGINVMGSTLPGSPGVIIGFNDSIAWGNTNAKRDLVDWYYIEFRDHLREEYKYDNKWLKTQKIVETINIKNEESIQDTIVITHYGPVSYDRNFRGSDEEINLAMRWTAHDASKEAESVYRINRASNYQDFMDAFKSFTGPPQNYSFASTSGDIALWVNGKFPVKWEEQGKFLLDGRDSRHEWADFMPMEHNYHVLNPPQNFVSSANQHPGDSTYPYYDYDYNWEYYRNRRINDRLKVMSDIRPEDMMKLQNDNFNYQASESLPLMLDSLDTASFGDREWQMYRELRSWDYFNEPDRKMPSVYELWSDILYPEIWDEFENQEVSLYRPKTYNTIYILKNHPNFQFIDKQSTPEKETVADLMQQTYIKTLDSLDGWIAKNGEDYAWYKFKNTTIQHLLRL